MESLNRRVSVVEMTAAQLAHGAHSTVLDEVPDLNPELPLATPTNFIGKEQNLCDREGNHS